MYIITIIIQNNIAISHTDECVHLCHEGDEEILEILDNLLSK